MASQNQLRRDSKVVSNISSNGENKLFRATHTEGGAVGINAPDIVNNVFNNRPGHQRFAHPFVLPHKQAWYPCNYKDEWMHSNIFVARMVFLFHWPRLQNDEGAVGINAPDVGNNVLTLWSAMLNITSCRFS